MIIKEYRIVLPLSLEQYRIAHLWSTSVANKNETGGGEGVEIVLNEPRDSGQFTHKIVNFQSKVPSTIRVLAPKGALELHQTSQNEYPYVSTKMYDPSHMKDKFAVEVKSWHKEDFGERNNVHNLTPEELQEREIVFIDFVNDKVDPRDYAESEDPTKFVPKTSKLGPLTENWLQDMKSGKFQSHPHVCVYKLLRVNFQWFGLQETVERRIHLAFRRYMHKLHRQLYCWMDNWSGLTMNDVRKFEAETKDELNQLRFSGQPRGMSEK